MRKGARMDVTCLHEHMREETFHNLVAHPMG
jgi:hypothetical protein